MASALFTFRAEKYTVEGCTLLPMSGDGDGLGKIVRRVDRQAIPGAEMRPGPTQIGLPPDLDKASERALRAAERTERRRRRQL